MISLRKLAKECNVSVSTVSRALGNHASVKAETRERIQKVAESYQYVPNHLVEGLFTGRSRLIAIICSNPTTDPIAEKTAAIIEEVRKNNWGCLVYDSKNCLATETECINHAISLRVSGMIISSMNYNADEDYYYELTKYKVPFILTSEYSPSVTVPHVHTDDYEATKLAIKHLKDLKHTKIALISGPTETQKTSLRYKGFCDSIEDLNLETKPEWIVPTDWSINSAREATLPLLKQNPDITAVVSANGNIAVGAHEAIKELKLDMPGDVSLIGLGDCHISEYCSPRITSINHNMDLLGKRSVEVLLKLIKRPAEAPLPRDLLNIVLPTRFEIRDSTGRAKKQ